MKLRNRITSFTIEAKQRMNKSDRSQSSKQNTSQWISIWTALFLTISLLTTNIHVNAATSVASPSPSLHIDGQQIRYTRVAPVMQQQTTLVPLRATLEAMGAKLVQVSGKMITASIHGKRVQASGSLTMVDGVTYVPVRTFAELTGHTVTWNSAQRIITLSSGTTTAERPTGSNTSPSGNALAGSETNTSTGRGFLWEVKHGDNTVYLVGSMHIADKSFYPLRKEYEEAFQQADVLGVEVDISKVTEADQQLSLKLGMYEDGSKLQDHIAPETYAKLGKVLEQNGMKPDALDAFKPWFAELTLATLDAAKSGYEATEGIDLHFLQKAAERKLPVTELETFDSQMKMISGFSEELQEKNLNTAIDQMGKSQQETLKAMAEMWKSGNDEQLLELTNSMGIEPEYKKAMLTDRNIHMVDKIDGYLQQGDGKTYFIVIGAGHYLGQDGIVQLLQNKGYTVERK